MTALELWTRIAIILLVAGSSVVFAWFVRDLLRLERTWRGEADPDVGASPRSDRAGDQAGGEDR